MVVVVAHWPTAGVKVYVVVAVLLIAGLQLPVMPLFEVVGRVNVPPVQIAVTWVKSGVTFPAFTVTVIVAVVAHCPVDGVKVYVVVAVLFIAGLHVPVMPLFEVVGKVNVPPLHIAAT
jgi:hypothetical protein